ncbi:MULTISPECIES: hypothetical protein [unclassified Corallococcus]|uniref:hypothetical protein n=1 Tax=unclassified Corallococcus TaxID=2685029 RepID=UPI001A8F8351|nr:MULTISPECIES: hypothetical protein [unclassified Corallococcus]MBN9687361.1 hypothetical protein [Corallococcus sp. NCSPR001]WAS88817.1 hypothetical protein O0N60_17945 [Corallococcus sp. NCRR]
MANSKTQQFFDVKLPAAFATKREEVASIGVSMQFNVSGAGGGAWLVNASRNFDGPVVKPGNLGMESVTFNMDSGTFERFLAEPTSAKWMEFFFSGNIAALGNETQKIAAGQYVPRLFAL